MVFLTISILVFLVRGEAERLEVFTPPLLHSIRHRSFDEPFLLHFYIFQTFWLQLFVGYFSCTFIDVTAASVLCKTFETFLLGKQTAF